MTSQSISHRSSHLALFVIVIFTWHLSNAQSKDVNNWKLWMIDNPSLVSVPAPPSLAETQKEIVVLKQRMKNVDDPTLHKIKYWDAGAPSYRWNQIAPELISFRDFVLFTRTPSAWMNLAIYDATILGWQAKNKYKRKRPAQSDASIRPLVESPATPSYPCEHSLTASAAAHVLAYFYPAKADSFIMIAKEAAQSRIEAGLQYPSDVDAGWKLGEAVAKQIIEKAKQDGSDAKWDRKMRNDSNSWVGPYPVGITTASFKPILLKSNTQFRPAPPPDFANDMKELKNHKRDFYSNHQALYWAKLSGFEFWTDMASRKMFEYKMMGDAPMVARIYAALHVAMHDAAIVIMDAKYAYWGIRPFQYDTKYEPLIDTPPFPGYPSGHATASSTAATVLGHYFPGDANDFMKYAKECAESRFYAGIHFRADNETGLEIGKKFGEYAIESWNRK